MDLITGDFSLLIYSIIDFCDSMAGHLHDEGFSQTSNVSPPIRAEETLEIC